VTQDGPFEGMSQETLEENKAAILAGLDVLMETPRVASVSVLVHCTRNALANHAPK
jgi:hypothetical protein